MLASTLFDVDVLIYVPFTDHQQLPVGGRSRGDVYMHIKDSKLEPLIILLS